MLLTAERRWECPNCDRTDVTQGPASRMRMHMCAGLRGGFLAPMVPAGTRCKVVAVEREDYIGEGSTVTADLDGRPIMAVKVVRDDGEDRAVMAPCASIQGRAFQP